jgi:hypothetical protein
MLKLRLTQASDFNDPFELLPNIDALVPAEQLRGWLSQFEEGAKQEFRKVLAKHLAEAGLPPQIAEFMPYEVFKAMGFDFVALTESLLPRIIQENREQFSANIQQSVGGKIGILSLSENPTSLLMWAHYSSSHQGFLLEFDSSNGFFNQPRKEPAEVFGRLYPVSYAENRPAITMYDPSADEEIWAERLVAQAFLTKSTDWSYEREWRMFQRLDDLVERPHDIIESRIHLFDFPPAALFGVIVGARASSDTREQLKLALESSELEHVRLLPAKISTTRFEVVIGKADDSDNPSA